MNKYPSPAAARTTCAARGFLSHKGRGEYLNHWLQQLENQSLKIRDGFKLDAIHTVTRTLNLLPVKKPFITVGGTNGKGSCVAICEAILRAAGYKTGSYFSPHLFIFNERIRINNEYANDEDICEAFEKIEKARGNLPLSYFEFATLAALLIFQKYDVDVYVLEVGVGGRLDSVNIIDADVAVITSIDIDHAEWLGDTREKIALEKAGIFRAHRPAICGDAHPPATLFDIAKEKSVDLQCLSKDYFFKEHKNDWSWWNANFHYDHLPKPTLLLQNAATALAALMATSLNIPPPAIHQGLQEAFLPGRFQIVQKPILQIFDVAHNPAAAKMLCQRVAAVSCSGYLIAVVGMLKDKDIHGTLQPFVSSVDRWYCVNLDEPRGASAELLASRLEDLGVNRKKIICFDSPRDAQQAALKLRNLHNCVVTFGSFRLIMAILQS